MRLFSPLIFALSIIFCNCDPAPEIDGERPLEELEYTLVEGPPYGTILFDKTGTVAGFRLQIDGDSVRIFNPFRYTDEKFRAYVADSTARFPDSLYLTYQIGTDSTLNAVVRSKNGLDAVQRYRPGEKMEYRDLPDGMGGQAHKITLDGTDHIMYFEEMTGSKDGEVSSMKMLQLMTLSEAPDPEIISKRTGYGMGDQLMVVAVTPGTRGFPRRGNHDRLSVSLSPDGRLQGYFLHEQENRVEGPIFAESFPSVIPDSVPMNNLVNILNTGRITVLPPPPEPDSVGIEYSNVNEGLDNRLVSYEELDHLDFEFAEDGGYTLFAGNRMLQRGKWAFSEGRQLIDVNSTASMRNNAQLIEEYAPGMLVFSLPIEIQTREARGVRLVSYYTPMVRVKFELPVGSR